MTASSREGHLGRVAAQVALCFVVFMSVYRVALALTADEVLRLRQSGVSDETIQKMLDQERSEKAEIPAAMVQQEYAQKHIGTWTTSDGSVVLSTGQSTNPDHYYDPTLPGSGSNYPIGVYPYVFPGAYGSPGPMPYGGGAAGRGPVDIR